MRKGGRKLSRTNHMLALAMTSALLASGCLKLGPDFKQPEPGFEVPEAFQHAPAAESSPQIEDPWWEDFGDSELAGLVDEVLENNLDIRKATAAILEGRADYVQVRAARFPTVDIQGDARRQQQPIFGLPAGAEDMIDTKNDLFTLSLPAAFELDLWGRLARAQEAARAELLGAEESRRTVVQTVVAEAITLYFRMESLERRIAITEESISSFRRSLAIVEGRYERGLTSVLDVRQARRTLAQAKAAMPALRQDLGTVQQALAVLLGRYPETRPPRPPRPDPLVQLASVPPGLPSDLLLRRPDIRAAEASIIALNALVGVAKASRFPRIALTGAFGYTSDELDRLVRPESELWNMAAGLTQPLLHFGKLKAVQRAAEARYAQGEAEYARALLTAFAEVEGSLLARKEQLERRSLMLAFLEEARATQRVAEGRYERGLIDYLTVLEAQQVRFQAEESMVLVDLAILNNRVTLYRALGGSWAELPAVEVEKVREFLDF